jgi:hypothetical protein
VRLGIAIPRALATPFTTSPTPSVGGRARSLDTACQIIEHYNDTEGHKFPKILRVIEKAKEMAEADARA